jgi:chromosome segregation ATPase
MLFATDVDLKTVLTLGAGAAIAIFGALSKNINDIVKNWFTARAQAKVETAKADREDKDAAFERLTAAYDRLDKEITKRSEQLARQETHIDSLTDQIGELRQENAVCQAEHRDMREYWEANRTKLAAQGVIIDPLPVSNRPEDHQRKTEREFHARQLDQTTRSLKELNSDLLPHDQTPPHAPEQPT